MTKRDKKSQILLGYEAGTAEPVYIPLHHLVVTGLTRLAGKTTTLEGLISRSEMTSIAFRTKRGEGSFQLPGINPHRPFFRERADWEYVQGLLEATMREKMKFERSWIIDAAKGAESLRDVYNNVVAQLEAAKGLNKSVLTTLRAYLEKVVPEIEAISFARELDLKPGCLNVMDLIGLRDEVQNLVVASTLETLHKEATEVIVVIPEAWKFAPQERGSPVKYSLEAIARQGAGVGIYVFLDSQDITGVDKAILKQVDTWLIGRQREKNEVERAIDQLPLAKGQRPRLEEVMRLPLGHFFVATRNEVRMVYAKPAWLSAEVAAKIAKTGNVDAARIFAPESEEREEIDMVSQRERDLERENRELKDRLKKLEDKFDDARATPALVAKEKRGKEEGQEKPEKVRYDLNVEVGVPHLRVREKVIALTATQEDRRGQGAILVADGFFDESRRVADAIKEFSARGWGNFPGGSGWTQMNRILLDLTQMGFLRAEGDSKRVAYVVVEEAKDRIERVKEPERR